MNAVDFSYFAPLEEKLTHLDDKQIERVRFAYEVAYKAHLGQFRSSGEFYITHPVAVAVILAQLELDYETIIAAILHDTIEDTEISHADIVKDFGDHVALLVEGVSKLDKLKFRNRQEAQAENFRKMILAMAEDVRVILIKFADRTHNMRTLGSLRPDKQRRIARETLEIYVPIASRLGIHSIKNELENRSFEAIYPMRANVLKRVISAAKNRHTHLIAQITDQIKSRLQSHDIQVHVLPHERSLYEIYQSVASKEQRFHSIMDIYLFTVIVKNIDDCYRSLGYIHNLYKPKPLRFKDFIAVPKINGYQSLHSSLIGPHGTPVNVQIRTEEMNSLAQFGIIAHWNYIHSDDGQQTTPQIKAQNWLKNLATLQKVTEDTLEFVENVKSDFFPKEIYVFTPKGRIIELPLNATPIDFAYEVHTDVGNHCLSATVNYKPVDLSTPLQSGQTVEIKTAKKSQVNAKWLNFVTSSKSKSKIKSTLKELKREDAIHLGKALLNHVAIDAALFKQIQSSHFAQLKTHHIENKEDLYGAIGLGYLNADQVSDMLENAARSTADSKPIVIHDHENQLLTFASCCHPIPFDAIVGEINPGKGIVIHHRLCQNVQNLSAAEKMTSLSWDKSSNADYVAELVIISNGQSGEILTSLIAAINQENSTILWLHIEELNPDENYFLLHVAVKNETQLETIVEKISQINEIINVHRNINPCTT